MTGRLWLACDERKTRVNQQREAPDIFGCVCSSFLVIDLEFLPLLFYILFPLTPVGFSLAFAPLCSWDVLLSGGIDLVL